ncbi:organic cation transporter protein-like [Polistes fuscatus]|uniref:organic cation transporter protein-like n=1 Tax=Polistes fuscatus TaxID=30207 RepID=UPI001CA9147A|nr:organic cation transporter protein-like [Polistes fuscatus]
MNPLLIDTILTKDDFEVALAAYSKRTWFITWLFMLCFTSCTLNGFHVMSYVFYSVSPKHWCSIPALEKANWTSEQIRTVSSLSPDELSNCEYYDWNYEELANMGYDTALKKVETDEKPKTIPCKQFSYEIEYKDSSFVPEWDIVCDRLVMKATVQTAVSVGKFVGAFIFGVLADRYGRKITYLISCVIYMISGPLIAFTHKYIIMLICRVGLGVAGIGIYQATYSILIEISPPHLRSTLGVMFNQSYAFGMILIAIIAYFIREWRILQTFISLPTFILILHMLAIPESPRWLYYSKHKARAWKMVENFVTPEQRQMIAEQRLSVVIKEEKKFTRIQKFKIILGYLKNKEMSVRLILNWTIWFSTSMCYYALLITASLLKIDSYLYTGLSGIAEGLSYIIVIPLLNMLALFGKLCVSSVFIAVIIHCSELFPTVMRNIAIGSSSTWAHIGSTIAPYLVDYFVS